MVNEGEIHYWIFFGISVYIGFMKIGLKEILAGKEYRLFTPNCSQSENELNPQTTPNQRSNSEHPSTISQRNNTYSSEQSFSTIVGRL